MISEKRDLNALFLYSPRLFTFMKIPNCSTRRRNPNKAWWSCQVVKRKIEILESQSSQKLQNIILKVRKLYEDRAPEMCIGVPSNLCLNTNLYMHRVKIHHARKEQLAESYKPRNSQSSNKWTLLWWSSKVHSRSAFKNVKTNLKRINLIFK